MNTRTITLAGAAALLLASCSGPAEQAPAPEIPTVQEITARGKYLVNSMGCHDCHSPKLMGPKGPYPDPDRLLSGHPADEPLPPLDPKANPGWANLTMGLTAAHGPWGISFAANLTSDATGIGDWTEEQFKRALKQGLYKGIEGLAGTLRRVQHELFNLGSILATLPADVHPKQPRVTTADVERLEEEMDACQEQLPILRSFVLPGGSRSNADLHVCRTVCRRAERLCVSLARQTEVDPTSVAYLNRLSDAFFVWSRYAAVLLGAGELLWEPDASATGQKK